MANYKIGLGNQFIVSSSLFTADTDSLINIYRRRENISYKSLVNPSNVNLAYFSSQELNPKTTISIHDRSDSIISNRVEEDIEVITLNGIISYSLETDKFLVTNKYAANENTVEVAPLFLKHVIPSDKLARVSLTDRTIVSTSALTDVKLLNKNQEVISIKEVLVNYDNGEIYNNLENGYDYLTDNFTAYYISYSVRTGTSISNYTELLNNENIFKLATFDDYDEELILINDGREVYDIVEENINDFNISLSSLDNYSFKILSNAKIQLLSPAITSSKKPWFPRVSNGFFNTLINNSFYQFKIAEFNSQYWNPERPYKKIINEESTRVSNILVKLNHTKIYENTSDSLYIDIEINDKDNNGLAAFSTNSSKHGTTATNGKSYVVWSTLNKTGIRTVDSKTGFLDIENYKIKSSYKIVSSYYYEEEDYEINEVDLNPITNTDILDYTMSVFVDPIGPAIVKNNTLYYLLFDQTGRIRESNWDSFDNVSQTLSGNVQLFYEEIPDYLVDIVPSGATTFVDPYTVEGSGLFLIAGEFAITEETSIDASTTIDTRINGGGLKESSIGEAKELNSEVNWFWDLGNWDGTPYPGNASYLVEIPTEVLSGIDGVFTQKEVKDIIDIHTALGVYPVVKAYGIDPVVSGIVPNGSSLDIKWGSYGI